MGSVGVEPCQRLERCGEHNIGLGEGACQHDSHAAPPHPPQVRTHLSEGRGEVVSTPVARGAIGRARIARKVASTSPSERRHPVSGRYAPRLVSEKAVPAATQPASSALRQEGGWPRRHRAPRVSPGRGARPLGSTLDPSRGGAPRATGCPHPRRCQRALRSTP
eukprot:scaffold3801_cov124-Isochrysis_galbana.AAC.12